MNHISIAKTFQKKTVKLFEKLSKLKNELYKCDDVILEYVESQSRSSKIDTYIAKCQSFIEEAVEIIRELITVAGKSENSYKLIPGHNMWLHELIQTDEKIL